MLFVHVPMIKVMQCSTRTILVFLVLGLPVVAEARGGGRAGSHMVNGYGSNGSAPHKALSSNTRAPLHQSMPADHHNAAMGYRTAIEHRGARLAEHHEHAAEHYRRAAGHRDARLARYRGHMTHRHADGSRGNDNAAHEHGAHHAHVNGPQKHGRR